MYLGSTGRTYVGPCAPAGDRAVISCLQTEGTVNVRTRDNVVHGMRPLQEVKTMLAQERDSRSLVSAFGSKAADSEQQATPAAES